MDAPAGGSASARRVKDLDVSGRPARRHGRVLVAHRKTTPTRRFCVRPARCRSGDEAARPSSLQRQRGGQRRMGLASRWSRTAMARARASDSLKANGPVLSVRPTI